MPIFIYHKKINNDHLINTNFIATVYIMVYIPCKVIRKPFANRHYEQIKFVVNFDWLDLSKLKDFEIEVYNILKENPFDKDNRAKVISENIKNRIELLQKYINKAIWKIIIYILALNEKFNLQFLIEKKSIYIKAFNTYRNF